MPSIAIHGTQCDGAAVVQRPAAPRPRTDPVRTFARLGARSNRPARPANRWVLNAARRELGPRKFLFVSRPLPGISAF